MKFMAARNPFNYRFFHFYLTIHQQQIRLLNLFDNCMGQIDGCLNRIPVAAAFLLMLLYPLSHFIITGYTGGNECSFVSRKIIGRRECLSTSAAPAAANKEYNILHFVCSKIDRIGD